MVLHAVSRSGEAKDNASSIAIGFFIIDSFLDTLVSPQAKNARPYDFGRIVRRVDCAQNAVPNVSKPKPGTCPESGQYARIYRAQGEEMPREPGGSAH